MICRSLGALNYIHIWHDNSGGGASASWFLKYIIVRDLQTMEKFYFICQKWFAVEKDDGIVSSDDDIDEFEEKQERLFCRLNECCLWLVKNKSVNSLMFYQNKPITVSVKVIFGFRSFLDHHQTNSHVFNDVLAVSSCY